tara:strand:+ start:616 stop:861 length:246 start_codon:yes stop_codon:yes gene_type:complete
MYTKNKRDATKTALDALLRLDIIVRKAPDANSKYIDFLCEKNIYKDNQKAISDAFEIVCKLPVNPLLNHSWPFMAPAYLSE